MNFELIPTKIQDTDIIIKYKIHSILDYALNIKENENAINLYNKLGF